MFEKEKQARSRYSEKIRMKEDTVSDFYEKETSSEHPEKSDVPEDNERSLWRKLFGN